MLARCNRYFSFFVFVSCLLGSWLCRSQNCAFAGRRLCIPAAVEERVLGRVYARARSPGYKAPSVNWTKARRDYSFPMTVATPRFCFKPDESAARPWYESPAQLGGGMQQVVATYIPVRTAPGYITG